MRGPTASSPTRARRRLQPSAPGRQPTRPRERRAAAVGTVRASTGRAEGRNPADATRARPPAIAALPAVGVARTSGVTARPPQTPASDGALAPEGAIVL